MSLTFVGLGLHDKEDVSVKGLQVIRTADIVYLEHYTSILHTDVHSLESFYGKEVIIATREMVEGDDNCILDDAKTKRVVFLVAGDVFSATTHSDLFLRAKEQRIETTTIHNASILTAIGSTGLQLYQFGKTTSLVFFEPDWKPQTAYDVIKQNQANGLHTLVLLDIKVAESSKKDLAQQKQNPQKPRFMTVSQAIEQLLSIEQERKEQVFTPKTQVVGGARFGSDDQQIVSGSAEKIRNIDFGEPLHVLIVPGRMHFHEEDMLQLFAMK